jgi:hypothetical protein
MALYTLYLRSLLWKMVRGDEAGASLAMESLPTLLRAPSTPPGAILQASLTVPQKTLTLSCSVTLWYLLMAPGPY